jgi:NADPH-ferrihemoprotein reductase
MLADAHQPLNAHHTLNCGRSAEFFKPPSDLSVPVIMIGPGTGVAPFRGFLQSRRAALLLRQHTAVVGGGGGGEGCGDAVTGVVGAVRLYFGCRRRDEDFLFREELEGFVADGTLSALRLAASRAQAHKVGMLCVLCCAHMSTG